MPIDDKIDETFRELVEHAIRNQVDDMARVIAEAGEKASEPVASLIVQASAYITIYVSEGWPKDSNLKGVARIAAESKENFPVTADEIYTYLSRVVFGSEQTNGVFPDAEKAALIPLYTLAGQLVAFNPPQGKGWNDWIDVIEAAIEAAEQVAPLAAPAVAYRYLKK